MPLRHWVVTARGKTLSSMLANSVLLLATKKRKFVVDLQAMTFQGFPFVDILCTWVASLSLFLNQLPIYE